MGAAHDLRDHRPADDLFQAAADGLAHDNEGRLVLDGKMHDGVGDGFAFQFDHLAAQVAGQLVELLEGRLFFRGEHGAGRAHVDGPEQAVQAAGELITAADEPAGGVFRRDADDDALLGAPGFLDMLLLHVLSELVVHLFGGFTQRQLAQGGEVAGAEEVVQRRRHLRQRIYVAAAQGG